MVMDKAFKAYVYKNMFNDGWKFMRKNFKDIDVDKNYWLHKVGLSSYSPGKRTIGAFSLFLIGGMVGAAVALAFSPKSGAELRSEVKDKAMKLMDQASAATKHETNLRA